MERWKPTSPALHNLSMQPREVEPPEGPHAGGTPTARPRGRWTSPRRGERATTGRELFLYSRVDVASSRTLCAQLCALDEAMRGAEEAEERAHITLRIQSLGGDAQSALQSSDRGTAHMRNAPFRGGQPR